jgi:hypothetical protein
MDRADLPQFADQVLGVRRGMARAGQRRGQFLMAHLALVEQIEHGAGAFVEREDRARRNQVHEVRVGRAEFVKFAAPVAVGQHGRHCETSG